jgi:hypothetical protein
LSAATPSCGLRRHEKLEIFFILRDLQLAARIGQGPGGEHAADAAVGVKEM